MMDKIRTPAGRLFLLATGILLTSTVGHAAARMMAAQMAMGQASFAFELALLIAALLAAAHIAAFYCRQPLKNVIVDREQHTEKLPLLSQQAREVPAMSAAQAAQVRLPPGIRLDSNDAIMIASNTADRTILFVNAAFARLTGFDAGHWIGRGGDLLQAEGPLRMDALLWLDTEADGSEVHWIARMHRSDGSPFFAEAQLHPIPARDGGVGQLVLVMADVTRRVGNGKSQVAAPPCNGQSIPA